MSLAQQPGMRTPPKRTAALIIISVVGPLLHTLSESSLMSTPKLRCKKAPRMVVKMRPTLSSLSSVKLSMLKWRNTLAETGFLPPPGGPMAPTNWVSTMFLNEHGGLRSYLQSVHSVQQRGMLLRHPVLETSQQHNASSAGHACWTCAALSTPPKPRDCCVPFYPRRQAFHTATSTFLVDVCT